MENKLYIAAMDGNVTSLLALIQEDPLILERLNCSCFTETPLHISSMLGHLNFTLVILRRKPQLAGELDLQRRSPLHLAAANGHLEIVKALLLIDPTMCSAQDRNGRTPLHVAAIRGQLQVLKELVRVVPEAVRIRARGETVLHLCVRYYQLDTLKFLVNSLNDIDFLNLKDDDGFTALQLAIIDHQIETVNLLTMKIQTLVISTNCENFLKELDIESTQTQESLKDMKKNMDFDEHVGATIAGSLPQATRHKTRKNDWLEQKRNAIMVVASLIATMTYQIGVNPPGGVWQENGQSHQAGSSIMADRFPTYYKWFVAYNATGFLASIGVILLLISGLPLHGKIFTWILMTIMWIAIASIASTYSISITVLSSHGHRPKPHFGISSFGAYIVFGIVSILLLRNLVLLVLWVVKCARKLMNERSSNSTVLMD